MSLVQRNRAAFFDRDGTINVDIGYLHRIEDLRWVPGVPEIIRRHNLDGDLVVVISNQSGVARGFYSVEDVDALHEKMNERLMCEFGARIDRFYYCPHHPEFSGECDCRKPKPGLITKALDELNIDPGQSVFYGNSEIDRVAAQRAGINRFVLVMEGSGLQG